MRVHDLDGGSNFCCGDSVGVDAGGGGRERVVFVAALPKKMVRSSPFPLSTTAPLFFVDVVLLPHQKCDGTRGALLPPIDTVVAAAAVEKHHWHQHLESH